MYRCLSIINRICYQLSKRYIIRASAESLWSNLERASLDYRRTRKLLGVEEVHPGVLSLFGYEGAQGLGYHS